MDMAKAEKGFALKVKKALDLPTIVFSINNQAEEQKYRDLAIDYFFTDHLAP